MTKKTILIIASLSLFFAIAVSASAATDYPTIVEDYPNLPACENNAQCRPGQAEFGFPQFIKYIYLFAIGIVGIIGLLAIIMAAFGYVTSAGNPQKASGAKDKIISALLGILLLLGSVVLLNLINPDLLKLKLEAEKVEIFTDVDKCKQECAAAGPPSPACLAKCEGTTAGCKYLEATWQPTSLNAGESATLTLRRSNCTVAEGDTHKVIFDLKQVSPGLSTDLNCGEIISSVGLPIKKTNAEITYRFTFDKKCNEKTVGWNCKWGGITFGGDIICNLQKDKPEQFYLEGQIRIPSKPTYYIPRIDMTVIDGR